MKRSKTRKKIRSIRIKTFAAVVSVLFCLQATAVTARADSTADFDVSGRSLSTYRGQSSIVSIPAGTEVIGTSAFENNLQMEKVIFPNSLKRIKPYAFWGCDSLKEISFGTKLSEIGDYSFTSCKGLTDLNIPSTINSIGIRAFADCVNLRRVTLPASVTYIHESAFDGCSKVVFVCEEGSYGAKYAKSFYKRQAENTKSGVWVSNTSDQGKTDSSNQTGTNNSDHGDGLSTAITGDSNPSTSEGNSGENAFSDTTGDSADGYTDDPQEYLGSTTVVAGRAVILMDNRKPTVYQGVIDFSENRAASEGCVKYRIVDDKILADQAYYKDVALRQAILPEGIEEIGEFAFARSLIEQAILPEGLKKISYGAFYHCDHLEEVVIPDTVTKVEAKSFEHTRWVKRFLNSGAGGTGDFLISGGVLVAYRGSDEEVVIPDQVRVIAAEAFLDHSEIKSVQMSKSLTDIGEGAFEGCTDLTEIQWNDKILRICDRAFAGCEGLRTELPESVIQLGLGAFDREAVVLYRGDMPESIYESSAQRLYNLSYRFPNREISGNSILSYTDLDVEGCEGARASMTGITLSHTLKLSDEGDRETATKAFLRNMGKELPDQAICYNMELYDESLIPITKLGNNTLRVTMPLPESFGERRARVFIYDRNGQLSELDLKYARTVESMFLRFETSEVYGFIMIPAEE